MSCADHHGPVKSMLEKEPGVFHVQRHEAEIYKARNDWKEQPNGEGYVSRLVDHIGRDRAAQVDTHGSELEESLRRALDAAGRRKARTSDQENGVERPPKNKEADHEVDT